LQHFSLQQIIDWHYEKYLWLIQVSI
jgi:hypothetical protein